MGSFPRNFRINTSLTRPDPVGSFPRNFRMNASLTRPDLVGSFPRNFRANACHYSSSIATLSLLFNSTYGKPNYCFVTASLVLLIQFLTDPE